jgi:hypothetical protein
MNTSATFHGALFATLALCLATQTGCFEEAASSAAAATDTGSSAADLTNDTSVTPQPDVAGCTPKTCELLSASCGAPDDGCGEPLDCGECIAPLTCSVINQCKCVPDCIGKGCGEKDGCDGTCAQGTGCCVHECEPEGGVQCEGNGLSTCGEFDQDVCREWSVPVTCDSGVCNGSACCAPECDGKECGDDGCDGSCGECPNAAPNCSAQGLCTTECTPECDGKECGDDGCDGVCGTCPVGAPTCTAESVCAAECAPDCDGKECGDDGCGDTCGTCPGAAPTCTGEGQCVTDCTADCAGKECGDDGCGDTCGTCPGAAPTCTGEGQCVTDCTADCAGKECGDDGCGDTCGTCPNSAPICNASDLCEAEDPGCSDLCDFQGQTQCWNGALYQLCGDWDDDDCLEWTGATPCSGTGNCVNGACEEKPPAPACDFPMAPEKVITGTGATGSGVCDANEILTNDGDGAEFWSNQDNTSMVGGVPVTACRVIDFGATCTPEDICVEAWAGQNGCSGDSCGGACENCMFSHKVQLEVFSSEENSTDSFEYAFSMQIDDTTDPGTTFCFGGGKPMRYALVCRSGCVNPPSSSYNAFVDYVWLE